jgi:hypothetical protein
MKIYKKIFLAALVIIMVSIVIYLVKYQHKQTFVISGSSFYVEIADSEKERNQGLSGRSKLKDDEGMLFIFEREGIYPFWMKDMKFDLDFIWIRKGKVVDITKRVPRPVGADDEIATVKPDIEVDRVLEINSGLADRLNINKNDTAILQK